MSTKSPPTFKIERELMAQLAHEFPQYGFEIHKGYGTKAHREAIAENGTCVHHRLSFGYFTHPLSS